jgi:hypothetical protein
MYSEVEIAARNPVAYVTPFGIKVEIVGTDFRLLVINWESVQWGEYALRVLRGTSSYNCVLFSTALVVGSPHMRDLTFDHQTSLPLDTGLDQNSIFCQLQDFSLCCQV